MCASSPDAWYVADQRAVETDQRGEARAGHRGFVQVHDIGFETAQRFGGSARGRAPGAIGAIEPFDSHSTVGPTLTIDGSGGGPSHGREDAHVDVELPQFARQARDLSLHPAGPRHRIGRRHHDSHGAQLALAAFPMRSLGQLGWSRCHCSGRAGSGPRTRAPAPGSSARCRRAVCPPRSTERGTHHRVVVAAGAEVDRGRQQRGAGSQRERRRPARAASCVRRRTRPRRRRRSGRGRTTGTRCGCRATPSRRSSTRRARAARSRGPSPRVAAANHVQQFGRFERLDDGEHVVALLGHPRRGPFPSARGAAARGSRRCRAASPFVMCLVADQHRSCVDDRAAP